MRELLKYSLVVIFFLPNFSAAASCDDYPYIDGEIKVEKVDGGEKILATASASVSFDDVDSIKNAHDEATMAAKARVSRFFAEEIFSDEAVNKVVNESKSTTGNSKSVTQDELKKTVMSLRNRSKALLSGFVTLGDCYTKGREIRVSVGHKPETLRAAENLSDNINKSVSSGSNIDPISSGSKETLQGEEGFSHVDRLSDF